jgi:release factor glutamine methyltransferase
LGLRSAGQVPQVQGIVSYIIRQPSGKSKVYTLICLLLAVMNLTDLKLEFISILGDVYELDECTALFNLTADRFVKTNGLRSITMQDVEVSPASVERVIDVAQELSIGKPIQYIFGETIFYGLKFIVNSSVLIPRPETEELVHLIIESIRQSTDTKTTLLDIGTGSGCIPITLKKNLPNLQVSAIDISPDALMVAKKNAELNKVTVDFIHGDILNYNDAKLYDVIVSNPPYIKEDEKQFMHQNVLAYEPHLALFVSDENPLLFYKAIAAFCMTNLAENGYLFFEINEYLGQQVHQLLEENGFRNIQVVKDMQGKDRMVSCQYS